MDLGILSSLAIILLRKRELVAFQFSNDLAEEEIAGCFSLIVLWLPVFCVSFFLWKRELVALL